MPTFTRRRLLTAAAAAALAPPARAARRPNLLLIVTDDHRWDAVGCAGNAIVQTPNLDRLAAEGVRFSHCFTTPAICMASRAGILTAQHASRHGIDRFDQVLSPAQWRETFPALLRAAGYRTGFVGKWGLGDPLPVTEYDVWGGFSGQGSYYPADQDGVAAAHLERRLGDRCLAFLDDCRDNQPWCLHLATKAPHAQDGHPEPFRYDPDLAELYAGVTVPTPPTATEAHFARLPEFVRESEGRVRWRQRFATPAMYQESVKGYYRLITGVDRQVGRILDRLEARGWLDETVILFAGDNGFFLGEHGLAGKWLMHEESIRVPLILRDPRQPGSAGRVVDPLVLNLDLAPTLLAAAGLPAPVRMQGRSLLPWLSGEPTWRESIYYEHRFEHPRIPKSEGIRTPRWKYWRYLDYGVEELYDLVADPREERNLAGEAPHRAVLGELRDQCAAQRRAAG